LLLRLLLFCFFGIGFSYRVCRRPHSRDRRVVRGGYRDEYDGWAQRPARDVEWRSGRDRDRDERSFGREWKLSRD